MNDLGYNIQGSGKMADTSTLGLLADKFREKLYDEQAIIDFLSEKKYIDIEVGESKIPSHHDTYTKLKRFNMKLFNSDRTVFIGIDDKALVKYIWLDYKRLEEHPPPSNFAVVGCLVAVIIIVGLIIWFIVAMVGDITESWNEEEEFNPYIEDYDGDGLGGDADDHEILHNLPTMPTEPMDGE